MFLNCLRDYTAECTHNISNQMVFPKLIAYGGANIKQHGKCAITCEFNGTRTEEIFFITEAEGPAIIGLPTSLELNLVTLNCSLQKNLAENNHHAHEKNVPIKDKDDLVKQYTGCFDGIG